MVLVPNRRKGKGLSRFECGLIVRGNRDNSF